MPLRSWLARAEALNGAPGLRALAVSREEWQRISQDLAAAGGRLLALWGGAQCPQSVICAAYLAEGAGLLVTLALPDPDTPFPGLEGDFPAAARMQRAVADLSGLHCSDSDTRPWLRHSAWPRDYLPLRDPSP